MATRQTAAPPTPTRGRQPNPFIPAVKVEPKAKMFLFGATGVGKTHFGLTCPGPVAIIDTEGGTSFFAGRVPAFDVVGSKSYRAIVEAIEWIEANPGAYGTLVIDPITVIYEVLQDAAVAARTARVVANGGDPAEVDIEMRDWGRVKRLYKALMTRLVNLPLHVVVIAREKDDVVKQGGEMVRVGVKADAEKGTAYTFDVVANLTADRGVRAVTILKDRTGTHATGSKIADPTFEAIFGKVLSAKKGKDAPQRHVQSDEAAAHEDAASMGTKLATPLQVQALVEALTAAGFDPEEVREKKGWPSFGELGSVKVAELIAGATAKTASKAPAPVVAQAVPADETEAVPDDDPAVATTEKEAVAA